MKRNVISLTDKELKKISVITQANQGLITVSEAALALGLSERQVKRLKKKVRELGPEAVIHQNTGRKPANALSQENKAKILELAASEDFKNCNFMHMKDILSEHFNIEIGYATLHDLLLSNGHISPKKRRRYKPHRRRSRRPQAGLLLQTDATPYQWFKGDRKYYALHGAIDDATGQLTALFMTKNECLVGYFNMLRRTIQNYGVPCSLYADRHTIFQSQTKGWAETDPKVKINDTQLGRALKELGIELIAARSPQAKGRIERVWETLQSRLPIEFALKGITSIEEANKFLEKYIYAFNSQFAVEPENSVSMFTKPSKELNLDSILCIKVKRKLDSGGVFSYKNKSFKVIETSDTGSIPCNATINVLISERFGIKAEYGDTVFNTLRFVPAKRKAQEKCSKKVQNPMPCSERHQIYSSKEKYPKYDSSVEDPEILRILDEIGYGHIERMINASGMY